MVPTNSLVKLITDPARKRQLRGHRNIKLGTMNILLVDDDRNLATSLSEGLRKAMGEMGEVISVVVCFSGGEALSMLATQAFDLVISDYNMPGMLGLELLKKIRQDQREIILILSTAYGTEALAEEVQQLKIGYIAKPFELSSLVKLIQSLIRSKTELPSPKPKKLLGQVLIDSGVPDL